jgi:hypothetical protein
MTSSRSGAHDSKGGPATAGSPPSRGIRFRRQAAVGRLAKAPAGDRWAPQLVPVVVQELYVEDEIGKILGDLDTLRRARAPQIVTLALAIPHSWRPDDFRRLLRRLQRAKGAPRKQRQWT